MSTACILKSRQLTDIDLTDQGVERDVRVIDPDQALIDRMARGEEAALRALMDLHLERILTYARRMLGDASEAEDVAQDVFMRAWTLADKWQPGAAKYQTWLHRITHNLAIDRLRKRRGVSIDDVAEPPDPAPSADQLIMEIQRSARVNRAISLLPDNQRAAISLCHTKGLGNIEAAKVLGVSVEALESLLSRGRRKLREHLAGEVASLLDGVDQK